MIESIQFKNFKCLRDTTLPLSPCTILVGPNGSGKSTVLEALDAFRDLRRYRFSELVSDIASRQRQRYVPMCRRIAGCVNEN